MQAAVNKAIRVGRTIVLVLGVGVVLALVLGVTTVALAAVPGDPFKLGKVNVISNATTTLRGDFQGGGSNLSKPTLEVTRAGSGGPALKVQNRFEPGGIIGGEGIRVEVAPGESPISVNPDAGKSNLNVDRLDGKTALKTGPGNGKEVLFTALDGPEGLACDDGDVAIDVGATSNDINDHLVSVVPFGGSYQIRFQDNGSAGGLFRASILCSDSSKPFRD